MISFQIKQTKMIQIKMKTIKMKLTDKRKKMILIWDKMILDSIHFFPLNLLKKLHYQIII